MNFTQIIAPLVTGVGVASFAVIFTVLYRTYAASATEEYSSGKLDIELIDETIINNVKSSQRSRRVLRRIKKIFFTALVAIMIPLLLISLWGKITNGVAMIGGKGMIAVASPSMSQKHTANTYLADINNQINTYDMIVLEKVDSVNDVKLYDVVAYVNDEGINIIHRVVGFADSPSGRRLVTRGDYNASDDTYRPDSADLLGRYTDVRVPYLGIFVMFLQSYSGILTVAAIIYCLIMIESVGDRIARAREERLTFLEAAIGFGSHTESDKNASASFTERVRFKDYIYTFDGQGFVSKELAEDDNTRDINSVPSDTEGHGNGEEK